MEGCPAEEALRQWLEGEPDETADAALADHVTHCSHCRQRLDQLSGAADMRLPVAAPTPTLTESWTRFLRGLAASPPVQGEGREPRVSPALPSLPDYEILGELRAAAWASFTRRDIASSAGSPP